MSQTFIENDDYNARAGQLCRTVAGFAVEQFSMSRGQFLELTIVLILIFELVLIFLGVIS